MKSQSFASVKIEVIKGGLGFKRNPDVLPRISKQFTNKKDLKQLNGTI